MQSTRHFRVDHGLVGCAVAGIPGDPARHDVAGDTAKHRRVGDAVAAEPVGAVDAARILAGNEQPRQFGRGVDSALDPAHQVMRRRHDFDEAMIDAEMARALHPFSKARGDINSIREELLNLMWDDVGIIRDATGLKRGFARLEEMETELLASGIADRNHAFNLTWHDWLNLRSQIEVSKVIALAAMQRENSRGAHYRDDFKEPGDLATSTYTVVREQGGKLDVTSAPVQFTIVKPGETLLKEAEAAE